MQRNVATPKYLTVFFSKFLAKNKEMAKRKMKTYPAIDKCG